MTEKFNGFQILVAAVPVWHPLAILASVVEIEHGSYRIHAQAIYMKLLDPVEGVGNEEVGNLMLLIVEDFGTPVRVFALARVCVLKERLSVKISKAVGIPREVGRNPVQDDADAYSLQNI